MTETPDIDAYAASLAAGAPPLTDVQVARLRVLLRPAEPVRSPVPALAVAA